MWNVYSEMVQRMPNGSMRMKDNRPKYAAFMLTFSQTNLTIDYAYRQLLKLRFDITEVVKENHMDEGEHIHAVLVMDKGQKRRLSPEGALVGGERPNIKGKAKRAALVARRYIRKGYIEARGLQDIDNTDCKLQRLLHQKNYDEAVRVWPSVDPHGYIYQRNNGEIGLRAHYEKKDPKYVSRYKFSDFVIPDEVINWISDNIGKEERDCRSLILWGPTRMGKTQLARAIGSHWYINLDWDVTQIRKDVDYGVIDDMVISQFKYWKAFLGCQEQFTVTDKFHKKKQLIWGKPVVWLCNENPFEWKISDVDMEWIRGNCDIVRVGDKLYF